MGHRAAAVLYICATTAHPLSALAACPTHRAAQRTCRPYSGSSCRACSCTQRRLKRQRQAACRTAASSSSPSPDSSALSRGPPAAASACSAAPQSPPPACARLRLPLAGFARAGAAGARSGSCGVPGMCAGREGWRAGCEDLARGGLSPRSKRVCRCAHVPSGPPPPPFAAPSSNSCRPLKPACAHVGLAQARATQASRDPPW